MSEPDEQQHNFELLDVAANPAQNVPFIQTINVARNASQDGMDELIEYQPNSVELANDDVMIVVPERAANVELLTFDQIIEEDPQVVQDVVNVVESQSPQPRPGRSRRKTPRSKKKRRISSSSPSPEKKKSLLDEEDDDGHTCPICFDHWELSGDHRLVSLKCGHLFGSSCIKRWLQECSAGNKCCAICKTKALARDIRCLYAKKVLVTDNSEEVRLRGDLEIERTGKTTAQIQLNLMIQELGIQKNINDELQKKIAILQSRGIALDGGDNTHDRAYETYKLFMEKNIEISKEAGCRVMLYGSQLETLIVSQKSAQTLFPGFGVRFLDAATFRLGQFLHVSPKSVRDLSLNVDEDRLITATMDKGAKLFDINNKTVVNIFTPSDNAVWACAFERDSNKSNFLYLGTNQTYVYDARNPQNFIREFNTEGDVSPVLSIVPIPSTDDIPFGGILVCKLQSLWFYEYTAAQEVVATRLNVEGPFLSLSYDEQSKFLLISTRPSIKFPQARYIVAELVTQPIHLKVVTTFNGSKVQSQITRCTQINTGKNTVVAAYLQDSKMLTTWNVSNPTSKMQSLPVSETILDMCPVYLGNDMYLAALTDTKCRVYKMIS